MIRRIQLWLEHILVLRGGRTSESNTDVITTRFPWIRINIFIMIDFQWHIPIIVHGERETEETNTRTRKSSFASASVHDVENK